MYSDDEDHGKRHWTREQLHGAATILPLQTGTNRFASQKGMSSFGAIRTNVYETKDRGYIEPEREGEKYLRPIYGTNQFASQKGMTAIGSIRLNVPKIQLKEEWNNEMLDKNGETIIPLQSGTNKFASQSGQVVIGGRRNQKTKVSGRLPRDKKSEMIIPYQSGTNLFASQSGMMDPPGGGIPRQATTEVEGLNMSEDQMRVGTKITPYQSGTNQFATQKGHGGFLKHRDVLCKMVGGKEVPEDMARLTEGVLPLQSGTNRLASQKGMSGFGAHRDVHYKPKWKQEWLEEWEEAEHEWEESGRGKLVDQMKFEYERNERARMRSLGSSAAQSAAVSGDEDGVSAEATFSLGSSGGKKKKSSASNTSSSSSSPSSSDHEE